MSSGYTLNGNPWAGSFILEASTDGSSWEPMIAKSSNGTFLGKEGLVGGGGNLSTGYNSVTFSNTTFNIYKPSNSYFPPDTANTLTYTGTLAQSSLKSCTVTLVRDLDNRWDKTKNIKEDFSLNCVQSNIASPYWSSGTQLNCIVTNYDSNTGILSFNATPTIFGSCKFGIIVRNGEGTGMISNTFATELFNVDKQTIVTGYKLLLEANDSTSYIRSGNAWNDLSGNGYNGTLIGTSYTSSMGINFSGTSSSVCTGTIPANIFNGAHSICCWFYRTEATGYTCMFSMNTPPISGASALGFAGGNTLGLNQVSWTTQVAVGIDLGVNSLNKWVYAVIVYYGVTNGSQLKLYAYLDGVALTPATGSLYWNLNTTATTYIIGSDAYPGGWAAAFKGTIAHVAIYNKALTATEVLQNFNVGRTI